MSIGHSQTMLRTPSGPSTDGGSDRQKRLQIYRPVAIMWTLCVFGMLPDISGTHAECVVPAGRAVTGDRYSRYIKSLNLMPVTLKDNGHCLKHGRAGEHQHP